MGLPKPAADSLRAHTVSKHGAPAVLQVLASNTILSGGVIKEFVDRGSLV